MTLTRLILSDWCLQESQGLRKVIEGQFTDQQLEDFNAQGYNVYYLPNHPKAYDKSTMRPVDGTHIDVWEWCFVDMDLKDGIYTSKDAFIAALADFPLQPTKIVDSGNGVHVYWRVTDLDANSYLRLQRRLCRALKTDEAVGKVFQLMRLEGFVNTKREDNLVLCERIFEADNAYTCEQLSKALPPITPEDEAFCKQHYDLTYNRDQKSNQVTDELPPKFGKLLRVNKEVKKLWLAQSDDRSGGDFRLAHILSASEFSREEAIAVLSSTAKAILRAPVHRLSYATNIIDKIPAYNPSADVSSPTVRDILNKSKAARVGDRFPCHRWIDDTEHGFRLGQVIGIIGGSGVGKTTLTLNAFLWFAENNPNYHHFFFSLEQSTGEIAERIKTICGTNEALFDQIHLVSNYEDDGTYHHFSMADIQEHILLFEKSSGKKVGAVVVDHIGVLAKSNKNGENDGLIDVCRQMKKMAQSTKTMLLMLSQAPREKSGSGDIELDKSAAYGTVFFESFVDYCLCLWQPLKRVYSKGAPTIMAIKFAKIRHKRQGVDKIQEDVCYQFFFDPLTERLRELTQDEEKSAAYFQQEAVNIRKRDKKTDLIPYQSRKLNEEPEVDQASSVGRSNTH